MAQIIDRVITEKLGWTVRIELNSMTARTLV